MLWEPRTLSVDFEVFFCVVWFRHIFYWSFIISFETRKFQQSIPVSTSEAKKVLLPEEILNNLPPHLRPPFGIPPANIRQFFPGSIPPASAAQSTPPVSLSSSTPSGMPRSINNQLPNLSADAIHLNPLAKEWVFISFNKKRTAERIWFTVEAGFLFIYYFQTNFSIKEVQSRFPRGAMFHFHNGYDAGMYFINLPHFQNCSTPALGTSGSSSSNSIFNCACQYGHDQGGELAQLVQLHKDSQQHWSAQSASCKEACTGHAWSE